MSSRAIPQLIGRYEVLGLLGRGGMGVVYRGRDPRIGRPVAIKVLRAADDTVRQRFLKEAQSAGSLGHPNIVTIYDCGEHDDEPFIVMELVEGRTLAELLEHGVPLTLAQKLDIVEGICSGLDYAHERGIVHRDVKPANVLIGQRNVVKIVDFGIARLTESTLTQSGGMMGTPHYMSPEQIEGLPVDRRSDIFAVGLVFYEILARRRAFAGETPHVVMHAIAAGRPVPLRSAAPDVDPALEAIVERAIQHSPADRYQTLAEMSRDVGSARLHLKPGGSLDRGLTTVVMRRPQPLISEGPRSCPEPECESDLASVESVCMAQSQHVTPRARLDEAVTPGPRITEKPPPKRRVKLWVIGALAAAAGLAIATIPRMAFGPRAHPPAPSQSVLRSRNIGVWSARVPEVRVSLDERVPTVAPEPVGAPQVSARVTPPVVPLSPPAPRDMPPTPAAAASHTEPVTPTLSPREEPAATPVTAAAEPAPVTTIGTTGAAPTAPPVHETSRLESVVISDRAGVEAAVEQYRQAYNQQDIGVIQRVYPRATSAMTFGNALKLCTSVDLDFRAKKVDLLSDGRAQVETRSVYACTPKTKQARVASPEVIDTFKLEKRGGSWIIVELLVPRGR